MLISSVSVLYKSNIFTCPLPLPTIIFNFVNCGFSILQMIVALVVCLGVKVEKILVRDEIFGSLVPL